MPFIDLDKRNHLLFLFIANIFVITVCVSGLIKKIKKGQELRPLQYGDELTLKSSIPLESADLSFNTESDKLTIFLLFQDKHWELISSLYKMPELLSNSEEIDIIFIYLGTDIDKLSPRNNSIPMVTNTKYDFAKRLHCYTSMDNGAVIITKSGKVIFASKYLIKPVLLVQFLNEH